MKRQEEKQEKEIDQYIMSKVKEEQNYEREWNENKKIKQKEVMKQLLIENEERKLQAAQQI